MDEILDAYFGWRFVTIFAVVLIFIWLFVMRMLAKQEGNSFKKLQKKWWYWFGVITFTLNLG